MKLTGTYVWSATVNVEVPETATNEQQREALDKAAMEVEIDFKHPVLHDCSNSDLVD